ncbi:MAG: hypothetical protein LUQ65_13455 [Candidatus Helarchaeota archaeon]|nr:hypothetical protein [Candidatus Helarchaeota archaeon]
MSERIICAIDRNIVIFEDGDCRLLSSKFIDQYCANHEQIIRKRAWKSDGYGARFRMEQPSTGIEQTRQILNSASITGIASIGGDDIIFCVMVGDSSGLFRRSIDPHAADIEGHILHDRGLLFQDVTISSDGRMAFSILNNNGEQNIAVSEIGSPQYRELTEGDSVDRNPFWDPRNPDIVIFDSAPIAYENNGAMIVCPRSIMKADLKNSEIETIIESDKYDFINPQVDSEGNIWCIRRPYKTAHNNLSFLDLLLIPYKIGRAIFRAIEIFTVRNTGEPLITSGSNPSKARFAPNDQIFEGKKIDAERNIRQNMKSGDSFPGYIPRNWELIQIDQDRKISVRAKSVCSFTLLAGNSFIYSNGKFLFKSTDGNIVKIDEAILPTKIIVA